MGEFQHQKLLVYAEAVAFAADVYRLTATLPGRCRSLADQLFRAATSVVLNIAEGAAEYRPGEKAKFYRFSRRSAAECSAAADILIRIGVGPEPILAELSTRAGMIAAKLTRLIHHVEATRATRPRARPRRKPDSRPQTPDSRLQTPDSRPQTPDSRT